MERFIEVTGRGVVQVAPDVAYVTLFVRADGILMSDAVRAAEERCASVVAALKEQFGAIREIRTVGLKVGDKAQGWRSEGKSDVPRPDVVKGLVVVAPVEPGLLVGIVDAASRMGVVLQNPAADHSSESNHVFFYGCMDGAAAQAEATARGIVNARAIAETIARPLGRRVGEVLSLRVTDHEQYSYSDIRRSAVARGFFNRYVSTDLAGIKVESEVRVEFAME